MAYNKRNYLQKIIDIQNVYLEHKANGVTGEYIYQRYISNVYRISRGTFYRYLGINAKRKIKEIDNENNT